MSRDNERQLWARHLAGDDSARQKLIDSCASKCLAFAQHRLDQHERWDGFHVLLEEVARIVDKRDFDPDKASLPAFVDKALGWRVKDIRRRIKDREHLMVPTAFVGRLKFDADTGAAFDPVRVMAEGNEEAEGADEVEAEIAGETARLQALVDQIEDEADR